MSMVYLAAPIDKDMVVAQSRFQMAADGLRKAWEGRTGGLAIFDPMAVWSASANLRDDRDACRKVVAINETVLLHSDLLFLCYQEGKESWGVPMELKVAHDAGIPMVMWGVDYDRMQSPHILPVYAQAYFTDSAVCDIETACDRAVAILNRPNSVKVESTPGVEITEENPIYRVNNIIRSIDRMFLRG